MRVTLESLRTRMREIFLRILKDSHKTLENWHLCYYDVQGHRKVSSVGGAYSVRPYVC